MTKHTLNDRPCIVTRMLALQPNQRQQRRMVSSTKQRAVGISVDMFQQHKRYGIFLNLEANSEASERGVAAFDRLFAAPFYR